MAMKRIFCLFALICFTVIITRAQTPQDSARWNPDEVIAFAQYDTLTLEMDCYFPNDDAEQHRCIIFSYGGGFVDNNQRQVNIRHFCRRLADDGFVVVASNYRLGLQGVRFKGPLRMIKPLENAIGMASEDLMKVTRYVLDYASELTVDPQQIILVGSSAGAIISLQCDYERCNRTDLALRYLPEGFRYAGVIAFSGAIFTRKGMKYTHDRPAPTLFFHGTADKLVTYKKFKLFNIGFYGSDAIVRQFKARHYPHKIIRFQDESHIVSIRYLADYEEVRWFIDKMVVDAHHYEIDETFFDPFRPKTQWDTIGPGEMY